MEKERLTGSEMLARGALRSGVQFVTGYPGSPSTGTVEALLRLAGPEVRIEWATNEKSAFDSAFGASLAGVRSLLCLKSVGLNVALDSLMVSNLAPGDGGFVLLVGDDPGGWGSQNEEDSRPLIAAAEIPLLEPTSIRVAGLYMSNAFAHSERFKVPFALRITRALALGTTSFEASPGPPQPMEPGRFERKGDRFNVLPIHVVDYHQRLQATLSEVDARFDRSPWSWVSGKGSVGVIAAGYVSQKLEDVLPDRDGPPLKILQLGALHPLPERHVVDFMRNLDAVVVLEELLPYIETEVQAAAQRAGLTLPIYGRSSGHVPRTGELFPAQIAGALAAVLPDWTWPPFGSEGRTMPSREPLCPDCPYIPALESLFAVLERHGGRDGFIITGETGCMVRAQLPPWELLDVKYGMGSSIGLAAGLARSGVPQKVISISGDSALLHSGLAELIDAAQAGVDLLVVVLENRTTALSGGQPHPGTEHDAQGRSRPAIEIDALAWAAGAEHVLVVDPEDRATVEGAYEEALVKGGVRVVIARRACPRWE